MAQPLIGILTAQSLAWSSWYERRPGSFDPQAAFIVEGIGEKERIGDFGLIGGGAVFSTGSIAWAGSLPVNGFDNNVAQIMRNVLKRFLDPEPFTGFDASAPASRPMA